MNMEEFKWMEDIIVDALITLFKKGLYVCLYNMRSREYRNRKTYPLDDTAAALAYCIAGLLV